MSGFLLLAIKSHDRGTTEKQRFLCVLCSLSDRYKSEKGDVKMEMVENSSVIAENKEKIKQSVLKFHTPSYRAIT